MDKWKIPADSNLIEVDNGTSVQLVNEDGSRVVYISILKAEDENHNPVNLPTDEEEIEVIEVGESFHLRGKKIKGNEALIIVITFINQNDEHWARDFFSNIR
ncbi:MAG: hypothetical protein AB199_01490 [Parcubacteria bacterium C7867-004]|nr:MAG: hypothetical protein AB199_01490 [Parcubacteria bacterium C7867-004]